MTPQPDIDGRIGQGWGGVSPNGAHANVVLARRGTRSVALVWGALLLVLVVGAQQSSVSALLTTVTVIDAALFLALLGVSLRRLREVGAVAVA